VESNCPYSAKRFYFDHLEKGNIRWPLSIITDDYTEAGVTQALREGPYGRCVYACDNDVIDHQVVSMEYEGNISVTFTLTAFTGMDYGRSTRIFGTRGEIFGDSRKIKVMDFTSGEIEEIDTEAGDLTAGGGHGGGDGGLMDRFISSVAENDPNLVESGIHETLASHKLIFAAERARREGRVIDLT
jgi:predicted dehydrogenase